MSEINVGNQPVDKSNETQSQFTQEGTLKWIDYFKKWPVTMALIIICTLLFLTLVIYDRAILSFSVESLVKFGADYNLLVHQGEYWRLLTTTFLHAGILHFAVNMYMLFILGIILEALIGKPKYFLLVLITAMASDAGSFYFRSDRYEVSVGISGVVLGLIGALFIYMLLSGDKEKLKTVLNFKFLISILAAILGSESENVDIAGHFYGFLAGALLAAPYSYYQNLKQNPTNASSVFYTTSLMIALVCLAAVLKAPKDIYQFDRVMNGVHYRYSNIIDSWEEYDHMETEEDKKQRALKQIDEFNELLNNVAKTKQLKVEVALKEKVAIFEQIIKNDIEFLQKLFLPNEGDAPIKQEDVDAFYHIRDSLQTIYRN